MTIIYFLFTLLAKTEGVSICNELLHSPQQIRIAFRSGGMTVSWTTSGMATGANDTPWPTVFYGLSEMEMVNQSVGMSTTYGTFWFHNVPLTHLKPSTTYYYMIAGTPYVQPSANHSFTTAPDVSSMNESFVAIIVGDLGVNRSPQIAFNNTGVDPSTCFCAEQTMTSLAQIRDQTDWFIHLGDLTYADYYYLLMNATYEGILNDWQCRMQPITSVKPYMTLPGNHDITCRQPVINAYCPNAYTNFTTYLHRWYMAGEETGGFQNMWYSFDYGLAHFIILNTETDFPDAPSGPGSQLGAGHFIGATQQLAWFKQDLIKATQNRHRVPWIIVAGHRSFHSSQLSKPCKSCRAAFERLIYQYNVDIYLGAHVHWYERFYPFALDTLEIVSMNYSNIQVPIHITNGGAGNPGCGEPEVTPLNISAKIVYKCGYGQLIVFNATHAQWNFYLSEDGSLSDQIDIVKQRAATDNDKNASHQLMSYTGYITLWILIFLINGDD